MQILFSKISRRSIGTGLVLLANFSKRLSVSRSLRTRDDWNDARRTFHPQKFAASLKRAVTPRRPLARTNSRPRELGARPLPRNRDRRKEEESRKESDIMGRRWFVKGAKLIQGWERHSFRPTKMSCKSGIPGKTGVTKRAARTYRPTDSRWDENL